MAEFEYESISLVKPEAFVYHIPPRPSTTRAMRAADWNLGSPDWKGRMKIVSKGEKCLIKLEDRSGDLFAVCPVDAFPGVAVEPVSDSSRYFVLRLQDQGGRHAFVGLGFQDRGDAFDFNVALQDHFKHIRRGKDQEKQAAEPVSHVDYSLKQGQKISLKIGNKLKLHGDDDDEVKQQPQRPSPIGLSSMGGLLPPPPSTGRPVAAAPASSSTKSNDQWGDFLSASSSTDNTSSTNWVQF